MEWAWKLLEWIFQDYREAPKVKASQLIKKLQEHIDSFGDLPVEIYANDSLKAYASYADFTVEYNDDDTRVFLISVDDDTDQ